ncbi:glycosyltransferase family 39 protein [Actinoplanes derwentensis]|uniref:Dolichyl-phosphate-mannose-protein mannosyltransferase n=1 Tax=Actinoplanes derwentensis TaxID=113562 RepID=A0A1H2D6Y8_9ACTN|nr:glycosyltransferase family 39 protein [Actinoplanes derwentensis]SDT78503.1 Dolichyl-phosphate-mannose-protein mannosyltransferase [Actinoplanes derwentensis]
MVDALSDITATQRIESARRPVAWWPVGLTAATATLLLLITSGGYGYHRDELYFRLLSQHPQWGYVDQPPFTPMLVRFGIASFGDSVWAIRVAPAVLLGLTAVVAALIAREAGGGRAAQSIAAAGVFSTVALSAAHVTSATATDLLVWLLVLLLVVRALLWERPRAWLGAGVVAGLGLWNKHLVLLLLLCLAVALLLAGPREVFRSRHLWAGAGLAVLIGLPNLIYQVVNDFPQVELAVAVARQEGAGSRLALLPAQFTLLILPPVWIAGLVVLIRDPRLRRVRVIAVAYPLMLVAVLVTAGRPYHPLGLLFGILAIGAVPTERWLTGRRGRQALVTAGVVLSALAGTVMSLPVVPEDELAGSLPAERNETVADQVGWRQYVWQIGLVYAGLSPADQRRAVLFTGNYGEAGALDRFGPSIGLPAVYSGHNELHRFGPPPESKRVVVAVLREPPAGMLGPCTAEGTLHNTPAVVNDEVGARVYVCRPAASWAVIWPRVRHYS